MTISRIGVGIITHRRPEMFTDLLDSFVRMQHPDGAELIFLIVENDKSKTLEATIDAFRANAGAPVIYELEQTPGIPHARNKVLDLAVRQGCDFMTFVDDDEFVDKDWLVKMIAAMQTRALDLAGGPIRQVPETHDLGYWQKRLMEVTDSALKKRHHQRLNAFKNNMDRHLNIYTHNWCVRLSAVLKYNLGFDPDFVWSGGEDTKFCNDLRNAGGMVGWVPDTCVTETVPIKRLTIRYYYKRTRDLTILGQQFKPLPRRKLALKVFKRSTEAVLATLAIPFKGPSYFLKAIRKLALSVGIAMVLVGRKSNHYKATSTQGQRLKVVSKI
ncbi:glycosyltransferase family 2 protein [Parasulfitobacter algicola]|uniref:Glycosyltransferase n=1 Tax=Parasulfitobacter algicola TaxID=2614809 RepID=A0ABX2IZU8_9RHOB|nr:glycosyltransferase family 2 protein [Sulfitobacter algicola]NSX56304.1 glycosyltransferase [Sulfitobacter algicola]